MLDEDEICVVTGLPRSGTSLMMQMLDCVGFDLVYDDVKKPDEHNPKGYYEYSKMFELSDDNDIDWFRECTGKVININGELATYIPIFNDINYKVVYMMRDYVEITHSQMKKMGVEDYDVDEHVRLLIGLDTKLRAFFEDVDNIDIVYISYNNLIDDPKTGIAPLKFLFDIDEYMESKMLDKIDEDLYRNRNE